jgi:hypothetical protein
MRMAPEIVTPPMTVSSPKLYAYSARSGKCIFEPGNSLKILQSSPNWSPKETDSNLTSGRLSYPRKSTPICIY